MKLKELELMTGFQGKESLGKMYKMISMSDVDNDGMFEYSSLGEVGFEKVKEKYLLKKGDLIIKARGGSNSITIIEEDYKDLLVSVHFIIIRIKEEQNIDPYFLHLCLNSSRVKKYIKESLMGTRQQILKIGILENIEIADISEEKQKILGEMNRLGIEEMAKCKKYFILRDKLFNAKLEKVLKEDS